MTTSFHAWLNAWPPAVCAARAVYLRAAQIPMAPSSRTPQGAFTVPVALWWEPKPRSGALGVCLCWATDAAEVQLLFKDQILGC